MGNESRVTLSNLNDSELIDRFRYSHNNQYVGELYLRYAHLVLGLCIKYYKDTDLAQDATMNIFELLLHELKRHKIDHFKSWLYTVSKNYCLQELRKTQTQLKKDDAYAVFYAETMELDDSLHLNTKKELLLTEMEQALNQIKYNQRLCLKMFYLDGKSYADISKELDFSLKDVKSNIQNGKRNLKIILEKNHGG